MDVGAVGPGNLPPLGAAFADLEAEAGEPSVFERAGAVGPAGAAQAATAAERAGAAVRDAGAAPPAHAGELEPGATSAAEWADLPAALRLAGAAAQLAASTAVDVLLQSALASQPAAIAAEESQVAANAGAPPGDDMGTALSPLERMHAQTASAQVTARPASPTAGELHGPDAARDAMANQPDGRVDIGIQATPATLSSMRVEAGWMWPVFYPGSPNASAPVAYDDDAARRRTEEAAERAQAFVDDEDDDSAEEDAGDEDEAAPAAADEWVDTAAADWCEQLERSLRGLLSHGEVPAPLRVAAEQWQRGRCVVLCCPQGADPWGPAWAFVLWPRPRGTSAGPRAAARALPLTLRGERLAATLQWAHEAGPGPTTQWWQVRAVKEHHPQRGRQLYTLPAGAGDAPTAGVDCELQLGPVLSRTPRWQVVCVRVAAARRFWAALAAQWSVQLVVCSQALIAPPASMEVPAC